MPLTLCASEWEAVILPEYGANTVSLRYRGEPVLRVPESGEAMRLEPALYGTPPLLPANRTRDGRFSFGGREYSLPINEPRINNHLHGDLHTQTFTIVSADKNTAVLQYENGGEIYPFPFRLTVTCALSEAGYRQEYRFANTGEVPFPLMFAIHTTFVAADFSIPIERRWETDDRHLPTGRLLELSQHELCFRDGGTIGKAPDGIVSGFYTSGGGTARVGAFTYEVSPDFTQWILYNRHPSSGFLCIEPQTAPVNGLNMPESCPCVDDTMMLWTKISHNKVLAVS